MAYGNGGRGRRAENRARWLRYVFASEPVEERDGLRFEGERCWRVDPTRDGALELLAPEGAVVYLEGTTEPEVRKYPQERQIDNPIHIAVGTIWPVCDRHHMLATGENLGGLADVIETHRVTMPAIHTDLYREGRLLLEWYDSFDDEAILVSTTVDEPAVKNFAESLGAGYRLEIYPC